MTTYVEYMSSCQFYNMSVLFFFFFFFQAEDGIRDLTVTGVQTCALPISPLVRLEADEWGDRFARGRGEAERGDRPRRDLPVDRHETAQRAKAQKPDAREDDDHESGSQEDFRAEPHAPLCPTDRGGRRARSPAGPPEPAEAPPGFRLVGASRRIPRPRRQGWYDHDARSGPRLSMSHGWRSG